LGEDVPEVRRGFGAVRGDERAIAHDRFIYPPPARFYRTHTLPYNVSDGKLESNTATVHITVSQPGSQGFITGGGLFFQDGRKCTFGFVAKVQGTAVQGHLEFQDHSLNLDIKSEDLEWVYAPNQIDR